MKPTENISVIDVGSNTLRLLIGNIQNGKINRIYSDRVVTKLGKNFLKTKKLNKKASEKSVDTLLKFKVTSELYGSKIIIPIGTGVLREAEDTKLFSKKIYERTGLNIRIISGDEEAFYTLEGIKEGIKLEKQFIAIDVGGGSTEWIFEEGAYLKKGSLNIGALRFFSDSRSKNLPKEGKINIFKEKITKLLKSSVEQLVFEVMIITGGTAVTLSMIDLKLKEYRPDLIHGYQFSIDKLKEICEKIIKTHISKLENIVGISQDRLDTIIPGAIIIETLADFFRVKNLIVSDYGLIEGIMKNYKLFCYN